MDSSYIELKSVPTLPGVYQFKDKDGKIISEAEIKKEASKEIKDQTKEVSK